MCGQNFKKAASKQIITFMFVFGPTSADMKIVEFTAHRIFFVRIKLQ